MSFKTSPLKISGIGISNVKFAQAEAEFCLEQEIFIMMELFNRSQELYELRVILVFTIFFLTLFEYKEPILRQVLILTLWGGGGGGFNFFPK